MRPLTVCCLQILNMKHNRMQHLKKLSQEGRDLNYRILKTGAKIFKKHSPWRYLKVDDRNDVILAVKLHLNCFNIPKRWVVEIYLFVMVAIIPGPCWLIKHVRQCAKNSQLRQNILPPNNLTMSHNDSVFFDISPRYYIKSRICVNRWR